MTAAELREKIRALALQVVDEKAKLKTQLKLMTS